MTAAYYDPTGKGYYQPSQSSNQPFANFDSEEKSRSPSRKKTWIFVAIAAIAALAIGIGVGVGVGLSVGGNSDDSSSSNNAPTATTTVGSGGASATSSSVAYGPTTGVAKYSCRNGTEIESTASVHYIQDCNAAYLVGGPDMYDNSVTTANIANPPYTRYTLDDCIDVCDTWNSNGLNAESCRAITYYANLTQAYENGWGGNCFIKNGRPDSIARDGEDIDWDNTVSAFQSCLANGGC